MANSLKTMGPQLKSLSINLYQEDQVDYVLRNLEHIEKLNGLTVERDALFNSEVLSSENEEQELFVVNSSGLIEDSTPTQTANQTTVNVIEEVAEKNSA